MEECVGPSEIYIPGAYNSLAFNPVNGQPYLAFQSYGEDQKAITLNFNGTYWAVLGYPGFSSGASRQIRLAFNPSGQPYVGYCDYGNARKERL